MDNKAIRDALTALLTDVAEKAKKDALEGKSDIGSIFKRKGPSLSSLDAQAVEQAIENINKATATKEGTRRLVNGLLVAAKVAARIAV